MRQPRPFAIVTTYEYEKMRSSYYIRIKDDLKLSN